MKTIVRKIKNFTHARRSNTKCFSKSAAVLIFLTSAFLTTNAQNPAEVALLKAEENYRIGIGDVLRVTVVKQTLLSVDSVRVGNDGTIRLPMLNAGIKATCLTEAELSDELSAKYKKYLLDPQIYVSVREYNANPVAIVGAVVAPGRFQLQRPTRLLELLSQVNGPAANAGKNIQIIRAANVKTCGESAGGNQEKTAALVDSAAQEIISLPLADVLKGDENANLYLQAGDIVRVPEAAVEQAFIIGSVKAAAIINLKEPTTLSKAVAMAGGAAAGANLEKIKISRQQPNSLSKTEIIVNLKDIEKRLKDDVLLQPNDIVDVPGASGTRKFIKDIFRTVIPVVTRVPVVIP